MDFRTVEQDIAPILKDRQETRCDDMRLYMIYIREKLGLIHTNPYFCSDTIISVFNDNDFRIKNGIAPYETVSRVRRKLQNIYTELRPTEAQLEDKKDKLKYIKNMRGGGNSEQ